MSSAVTDALYNLWGSESQRVCVSERVAHIPPTAESPRGWFTCGFLGPTPDLMEENLGMGPQKSRWCLCIPEFKTWYRVNGRRFLFKELGQFRREGMECTCSFTKRGYSLFSLKLGSNWLRDREQNLHEEGKLVFNRGENWRSPLQWRTWFFRRCNNDNNDKGHLLITSLLVSSSQEQLEGPPIWSSR